MKPLASEKPVVATDHYGHLKLDWGGWPVVKRGARGWHAVRRRGMRRNQVGWRRRFALLEIRSSQNETWIDHLWY